MIFRQVLLKALFSLTTKSRYHFFSTIPLRVNCFYPRRKVKFDFRFLGFRFRYAPTHTQATFPLTFLYLEKVHLDLRVRLDETIYRLPI